MVALTGIGYQSGLPCREFDLFLSQQVAETEYWILA